MTFRRSYWEHPFVFHAFSNISFSSSSSSRERPHFFVNDMIIIYYLLDETYSLYWTFLVKRLNNICIAHNKNTTSSRYLCVGKLTTHQRSTSGKWLSRWYFRFASNVERQRPQPRCWTNIDKCSNTNTIDMFGDTTTVSPTTIQHLFFLLSFLIRMNWKLGRMSKCLSVELEFSSKLFFIGVVHQEGDEIRLPRPWQVPWRSVVCTRNMEMCIGVLYANKEQPLILHNNKQMKNGKKLSTASSVRNAFMC